MSAAHLQNIPVNSETVAVAIPNHSAKDPRIPGASGVPQRAVGFTLCTCLYCSLVLAYGGIGAAISTLVASNGVTAVFLSMASIPARGPEVYEMHDDLEVIDFSPEEVRSWRVPQLGVQWSPEQVQSALRDLAVFARWQMANATPSGTVALNTPMAFGDDASDYARRP